VFPVRLSLSLRCTWASLADELAVADAHAAAAAVSSPDGGESANPLPRRQSGRARISQNPRVFLFLVPWARARACGLLMLRSVGVPLTSTLLSVLGGRRHGVRQSLRAVFISDQVLWLVGFS
jgi:hypothetical protein